MSYTIINLDGKDYKFELTLRAIRDLEKRHGEGFFEKITSSMPLDLACSLCWFGLRKHHGDEITEDELLDIIPFNGMQIIAEALTEHLGGDDNEGSEGKQKETENLLQSDKPKSKPTKQA